MYIYSSFSFLLCKMQYMYKQAFYTLFSFHLIIISWSYFQSVYRALLHCPSVAQYSIVTVLSYYPQPPSYCWKFRVLPFFFITDNATVNHPTHVLYLRGFTSSVDKRVWQFCSAFSTSPCWSHAHFKTLSVNVFATVRKSLASSTHTQLEKTVCAGTSSSDGVSGL